MRTIAGASVSRAAPAPSVSPLPLSVGARPAREDGRFSAAEYLTYGSVLLILILLLRRPQEASGAPTVQGNAGRNNHARQAGIKASRQSQPISKRGARGERYTSIAPAVDDDSDSPPSP